MLFFSSFFSSSQIKHWMRRWSGFCRAATLTECSLIRTEFARRKRSKLLRWKCLKQRNTLLMRVNLISCCSVEWLILKLLQSRVISERLTFSSLNRGWNDGRVCRTHSNRGDRGEKLLKCKLWGVTFEESFYWIFWHRCLLYYENVNVIENSNVPPQSKTQKQLFRFLYLLYCLSDDTKYKSTERVCFGFFPWCSLSLIMSLMTFECYQAIILCNVIRSLGMCPKAQILLVGRFLCT